MDISKLAKPLHLAASLVNAKVAISHPRFLQQPNQTNCDYQPKNH